MRDRNTKSKKELHLLLHNIRSAYNVGSIFRTADCAGVAKLYLSGYTPLPVDKFGKVNIQIHKTALGGEKTVTWEHFKSPNSLIKKLRSEGFSILALEQDKNSVDYRKYRLKGKSLLILGTEVSGITKRLLSKADVILEIPMRGKKESLNVSVAGALAVFRLLQG